MRQRDMFIVTLSLCVLAGASFGASQYTTGIQVNDESTIEIAYTPIALNEGQTLEKLRKGEVQESTLENWNKGPKLGKLGKLTASTSLKVGEVEIDKGAYDCGLNVDKEGKFSFVIWKGEGDDAKAHATPMEVYEHDSPAEYLILSLSPNPRGEGSALWIAYGKYAAGIPVSLGAGEGTVSYSTGLSLDDRPAVHVSYAATPYKEGKTFKAMREGEMTAEEADEHFNKDKSFGKVGVLKNSKEVKVGDLPDAPPGEYPCGINVDGDGNFTFVGWNDEEVYKTPLKLEKHGFAVPHLAMILSPTGEAGCNLRLIYGEYHADVPLSVSGSGS